MARKLFRLGLDPASYNPVGLHNYEPEVLMEEYKRIQKEARARLESLRKSEYGRASETYKKNKGRYPAPSKIQDRRQLERAIQEGARFLASPRSTASGQQEIAKKQMETLGKHGYGWITRPMLRAWGEYLKWLGENAGRELYYSLPKTDVPPPATEATLQQAGQYSAQAVQTGENAVQAAQTGEGAAQAPETIIPIGTQKEAFYAWAEENGYLTYETVTRRGKEVEKEVWLK